MEPVEPVEPVDQMEPVEPLEPVVEPVLPVEPVVPHWDAVVPSPATATQRALPQPVPAGQQVTVVPLTHWV